MIEELRQPWSWVFIVTFLELFCVSMVLPVMSTYQRGLGISYFEIGLLGSLNGITKLIFGPIIGGWSDTYGRPEVLFLTTIVSSVLYGLMGVVSSFYLFLILNCVLGVVQHTMTLCQAYIADIVPADKQSAVIGLSNACISISFMIGPIIGGHVMEMNGGFQYITAAASLIFVFNAVLIFVFGNAGKNPKKEKIKNSSFIGQINMIFKDLVVIDWKTHWLLFSLKFLFTLSLMLFFQNMVIILTEKFDFTPGYTGYTASFYSLVSFICNIKVENIKSLAYFPKNNYESLTYLFCTLALTYYWLYMVDNCWLFLLGLVSLSAGNTLAEVAVTEVLVEQTDSVNRGSLMGVSASVGAVVQIFTPLFSGLIASLEGVSSTLKVSSIITATACFITLKKSPQVHIKSQ